MHRRKLNSRPLSVWATLLTLVVMFCGFVAAGFLLTAVRFGMESGELKASSGSGVPTQLLAEHAANIAQVGYVALEAVAAWALTTLIRSRLPSRLRTALVSVLFFVGLSAVSYLIVIAALLGFYSDPLVFVQRQLEDWILDW